jgi:GT2 family glycosyltransferase
MEISVLIACRDGEATIAEQLEALAAQAIAQPWEVIVTDNGSRDGSRELVMSYSKRFPHFKLVDAPDRPGLSYVRNIGAAAARGRSLAFCDQDDRVAAGWLETMATSLRAHELVAGRLEHDILNEPWTIEVRGRPQLEDLVTYAPGWPQFAFGCTLGVQKELHDRLGGFDENLLRGAEDADYCWRAQQLGARLTLAPDAITHYRFRNTLSGVYRQARNYGEGEAQVYAKHRMLGLGARSASHCGCSGSESGGHAEVCGTA